MKKLLMLFFFGIFIFVSLAFTVNAVPLYPGGQCTCYASYSSDTDLTTCKSGTYNEETFSMESNVYNTTRELCTPTGQEGTLFGEGKIIYNMNNCKLGYVPTCQANVGDVRSDSTTVKVCEKCSKITANIGDSCLCTPLPNFPAGLDCGQVADAWGMSGGCTQNIELSKGEYGVADVSALGLWRYRLLYNKVISLDEFNQDRMELLMRWLQASDKSCNWRSNGAYPSCVVCADGYQWDEANHDCTCSGCGSHSVGEVMCLNSRLSIRCQNVNGCNMWTNETYCGTFRDATDQSKWNETMCTTAGNVGCTPCVISSDGACNESANSCKGTDPDCNCFSGNGACGVGCKYPEDLDCPVSVDLPSNTTCPSTMMVCDGQITNGCNSYDPDAFCINDDGICCPHAGCPASSDSDCGKTNFTYDFSGNLIGISNPPKGISYDKFGRVSQVTLFDSAAIKGKEEYTYDTEGKRIKKVVNTSTGENTTYYVYFGNDVVYTEEILTASSEQQPSSAQINITSPTNGTSIFGDININVAFSPNSNVKIKYYVDGFYRDTETAAPWSYQWINIPDGQHILTADLVNATTDAVLASSAPVVVTKGTASCSCAYQGDANQDNRKDIVDLVKTIDLVYNSGTAPIDNCPNTVNREDANCDNLVNAADVNFLINAIFNAGTATCTTCGTTPIAPGAPTLLSATPANYNKITLNWNKPAGTVDFYRIEFTRNNMFPQTIITYNSSSTPSFTHYSVVGTYNYSIRACTNSGGCGISSSPLTATAISPLPVSISITSPGQNANFPSSTTSINIVASTSRSDNVKVYFYVNGVYKGVDTSASPQWDFLLPLGGDGGYTLTAEAIDTTLPDNYSLGISAPIFITRGTPPATITMSSPPTSGQVLSTDTTLTATSSASTGYSVWFYNGTRVLCQATSSSPWSCTWPIGTNPTWENGAYSIVARLFNTSSLQIVALSDPVPVSVNKGGATPTISITSPAEGATLSSDTLLTANPSVDGIVKFYEGANFICQATAASSWSCTWLLGSVNNGDYSLTAKLMDAANPNGSPLATSSSRAVHVNKGGVSPPQIGIISPANGDFITDPITITANPSPSTGVNVKFYVDGSTTPKCTVTAAPWNCQWTGITDGGHTIKVDLINQSNPGTVLATKSISVAKPSISITSPTNGAIVANPTTITANPNPITGVNVKVYIDTIGTPLCTLTAAPWNCQWTGITDGGHTIKVDLINQSNPGTVLATKSISVTKTTSVTILRPTNGATVGGSSVDIETTASDISDDFNVITYVDGVIRNTDSVYPWVYSWDLTGATYGSHTIKSDFVAKANLGTVLATNSIIITKGESVFLTSPVDKETISGNPLITAISSAFQNLKANFYVDGNSIGIDSVTPWEYRWDTSSYSEGQHLIRVDLVDYNNLSLVRATSSTISVTKSGSALNITEPLEGTSISGSIWIGAVTSLPRLETDTLYIWVDGFLVATNQNNPFRYLWDTTPYANGQHTIVVSLNGGPGIGTPSATSVPIHVVKGSIPTISISQPANGYTITSNTYSITATPSTNTNVCVKTYIDDVLRNTDFTNVAPGWVYSWDLTKENIGAHRIRVDLEDVITGCVPTVARGVMATSPTITVYKGATTTSSQGGACADGTLMNKCSAIKPVYCNNQLQFEIRCGLCGCNTNQQCQTDGSCKSTIIPKTLKSAQIAANVVENVEPSKNIFNSIKNFFSSLIGKLTGNVVETPGKSWITIKEGQTYPDGTKDVDIYYNSTLQVRGIQFNLFYTGEVYSITKDAYASNMDLKTTSAYPGVKNGITIGLFDQDGINYLGQMASPQKILSVRMNNAANSRIYSESFFLGNPIIVYLYPPSNLISGTPSINNTLPHQPGWMDTKPSKTIGGKGSGAGIA